MNKNFDDFMLELGEIAELEECLVDVLENCMFRNKKPFHSLALANAIKNRTDKLYYDMDDMTLQKEHEEQQEEQE